MKSVTISVLTMACLLLACVNAFAADDALAAAFQRGNTYIRYHLAPDALQSQNDTETTFTLTHRTIDAIDAYFECLPGMLPDESMPEPRHFEAQWNIPTQNRYVLLSSAASAALPPAMVFWNIGNLALGLGYDEFFLNKNVSAPGFSQPARQSIAGQLLLPLGETGFSFGASVLMHAVQMQRRADAELVRNLSASRLSINAEMPVMTGYAVSPDPGNQLSLQAGDDILQSSTSLSGTRNTVAGAVNVSGDVNGVQVFTEVGFVSGSEEYEGVVLMNDATASNFYAVGGANYTVGQVTLGFEAGFENGEELLEGNASLGFEHDFLVENVQPDVQPANDKVYASVSAKLSPTERMTIGGAFKYIQPLSATFEPYGFAVDGAFYYSLTSYLQYLAKAGVSTPFNSIEESQYKFINSLELTF